MLSSDYKPKCPSFAPLLQPERRKYLYGFGIFLTLFIIVLTVVLCLTLGGTETFVLDRTPFFAGRNNLPENLYILVNNNLTHVNLSRDLSGDEQFGSKNCSNCNTDFSKLAEGKVSSQFWVARAGCNTMDGITHAIEQIDVIKRMIKHYHRQLELVLNSQALSCVSEDKKLGSLITIDGGQSISKHLAILRQYYDLGVRSLSLATGCTNMTSKVPEYYIEDEDGNLTGFGEAVIQEMNNLGMIIDVTGLGSDAMNKVINISGAPVIVSHGGVYGIYNHSDNIRDYTLDLLKRKHGMLMVTFDVEFLGDDNITSSTVIRHINYIVDRIGFDNIGIGANFDSEFTKPTDLKDVSNFPKLFQELKTTNSSKWTADNLDKLAGLNFHRIFHEVEKVKNVTKLQDEE